MSQFRARTTQHTRTAPVYQCDHQSSPDPLPGDHTHGACLCALRKRQRQRREQENERDRPTERPRGGLASLDRGTERKRVRQVRPMSAYTTCTQRYHRLRVVRALTHGYDWSSFTPDDPPIKQCFFFELARSLSRRENEHKQTQTLGRGSLGSWIDEDRS